MKERIFCTAGPIDPEYNYFIPHRLNWAELHSLVRNRNYFALHAPRQSGKTTAIKEFCTELNREGVYHALYFNVESAQAAREDVKEGLLAILVILLQAIKNQFPLEKVILEFIEKKINAGLQFINIHILNETLEYLAKHSAKPIVLFIDEIDSLIGDTLLSVLRQIRSGFDKRPKLFPHSLCLIGLRDVRDYRIWSKHEGKNISTSSPFNIKSKSLIISNFSLEEIKALYEQHTMETGQIFTLEAIEYAFYLTAGQPWLTNALAYQACYDEVQTPQEPITKDVIERAKEALIKRRDTHIDSLIDKLREDRVRPIMEAIITGETDMGNIQPDDLQYVQDLGLIRQDPLEIANPIYREIIPRELSSVATALITQTVTLFKKADGNLDAAALIKAFVDFYRENSAIWLEKFDYKEAGPHLLMMAFLQRVINGGGIIHREYALGTERVDILLRWRKQTIVIELKIHHGPKSLAKGLEQTASYMDSSHADEGHLILFDRSPRKSWGKKIFHRKETFETKIVQVWGC